MPSCELLPRCFPVCAGPQSPLLIYDHSRLFESSSCVQQGDPLGPLYFCCGLQPIIDRITALAPTYQKWYMDDGGIVGPQDLLLKVWEILKTDGPPLVYRAAFDALISRSSIRDVQRLRRLDVPHANA